jgi:hypothetical protein
VRRVVFVLWAGCGFAPAASPDATELAADAPGVCSKLVATGGTPAATLGGNGGTARPDLTCAAGELPIGISVTTTQQPRPEGGAGGERVVTAFDVLCGTVIQMNGGSLVTATAEPTGWTANACAGWGPYVPTPVAHCPDNTILVGLTANGGPTTLFNTVSLTCALVNGDSTLGPLVTQPVADSGSYSNHMEMAKCPAGQVVIAFKDRGDCGVDGIAPVCAPLQCK